MNRTYNSSEDCFIPFSDNLIQHRKKMFLQFKREMPPNDFLRALENILADDPSFLLCIPDVQHILGIHIVAERKSS